MEWIPATCPPQGNGGQKPLFLLKNFNGIESFLTFQLHQTFHMFTDNGWSLKIQMLYTVQLTGMEVSRYTDNI